MQPQAELARPVGPGPGLHPEVLDQPLANPQQPLLILTRRRQNEERVGVGEGEGRGGRLVV